MYLSDQRSRSHYREDNEPNRRSRSREDDRSLPDFRTEEPYNVRKSKNFENGKKNTKATERPTSKFLAQTVPINFHNQNKHLYIAAVKNTYTHTSATAAKNHTAQFQIRTPYQSQPSNFIITAPEILEKEKKDPSKMHDLTQQVIFPSKYVDFSKHIFPKKEKASESINEDFINTNRTDFDFPKDRFVQIKPIKTTKKVAPMFRKTIRNMRQREVGNNQKQLAKSKLFNSYFILLDLRKCKNDSPQQIIEKIFENYLSLIEYVAKMITKEKSDELILRCPFEETEWNETIYPPLDLFKKVNPSHTRTVSAPEGQTIFGAPGLNKQHHYVTGEWVSRINADRCSTSLVGAKTHDLSALMLAGNTSFYEHWESTHTTNLLFDKRYGNPKNQPYDWISLFTVDHFLTIETYIEGLQPTIKTKMRQIFSLHWSKSKAFFMIDKLNKSVANSTLGTYFGHLNRLSEYLQYRDMIETKMYKIYEKSEMLQMIMDDQISLHILSAALIYFRDIKNDASVYILGILNGWAFFFRNLRNIELKSDNLISGTRITLKNMPHVATKATFPFSLLQMISGIEIAQDICPTLPFIMTIGIPFITRRSEIANAKFDDFSSESPPGLPHQVHNFEVQKSKNHKIPLIKTIPVPQGAVFDSITALESLRIFAKPENKHNGFICIDTDGNRLTKNQFTDFMHEVYGGIREKFPELEKKILAWHSWRGAS